MKNKVIIPIIVIAIIIIIIGVVLIFVEPKPYVGKVKSFHYGKGSWTYVNYDIKKEKDKVIFVYETAPEGKKIEKEVDEEVITKLENIINKYKVNNWDGFSKTDKNVLDGNSFNITIKYEDKKEVTASGYMRYPKRYSVVSKELDKLFNELLKED